MIHLPVLNVNYIVTPVGGENERLFMCERLFESVKHRFIKTEYSTTKTFIFLKKRKKKSQLRIKSVYFNVPTQVNFVKYTDVIDSNNF